MSDRPGKSRPMPAAPYDDPSIPVLTERLTLPSIDLDISLPPGPAPTEQARSPAPPPTAESPKPAAPPPAVLGGEFESDTWLVETIPLAPPPLDPSLFELPSFELPPLGPLAREGPPLTPTPAAPPPEPGFAASDLVIPASLMRTPPTAADTAAVVHAVPTFDRLPAEVHAETLPAFDLPSAPAAFAVAAAPAAPDDAQLREAILEAVLQRLPQEVDALVRRQLAPAVDAAVDAAVARLAAEIGRAAAQSLRELVEQAVRAELARLRERKPG